MAGKLAVPAEEKDIKRVWPVAEAVYITGQARDIRPVMAAVVPERERVRNAMGKVIIRDCFCEVLSLPKAISMVEAG